MRSSFLRPFEIGRIAMRPLPLDETEHCQKRADHAVVDRGNLSAAAISRSDINEPSTIISGRYHADPGGRRRPVSGESDGLAQHPCDRQRRSQRLNWTVVLPRPPIRLPARW
jgi:hypothetical protein